MENLHSAATCVLDVSQQTDGTVAENEGCESSDPGSMVSGPTADGRTEELHRHTTDGIINAILLATLLYKCVKLSNSDKGFVVSCSN